MSNLSVPYNESSDYVRENPRMGEHQAVCSQIHNLGHQLFKGNSSLSPQVAFIFEIAQTLKEGNFAGRQMCANRKFSLYFGKNNELRKFIGDWRGKALSDEECKKFDFTVLIGKAATIVITHNQGTGANAGKTYANIAGIAPPSKTTQPVQITFTDEPEWVKKKKAEAVLPPPKTNVTIQNIPSKSNPEEDQLPF